MKTHPLQPSDPSQFSLTSLLRMPTVPGTCFKSLLIPLCTILLLMLLNISQGCFLSPSPEVLPWFCSGTPPQRQPPVSLLSMGWQQMFLQPLCPCANLPREPQAQLPAFFPLLFFYTSPLLTCLGTSSQEESLPSLPPPPAEYRPALEPDEQNSMLMEQKEKGANGAQVRAWQVGHLPCKEGKSSHMLH